jgi:Cu(I)/Ag(I) efflux system membrane fusion protein
MFVQVSFEKVARDVIAVPRSAVLDTGKGKIVYVAKGNGVFEKRLVEGSTAGPDYYAATRGIQPGERVVTHGNFLIDSQTRLTNTIAGMFTGSRTSGADANETPANASNYTITLQSEPASLKGGSEGTFRVHLIGPDQKPLPDAQLRLTMMMPAMPSMGMGEMHGVVDLTWNGSEYIGKGAVAMAGPWNVTIEARRNRKLVATYRTRFDAK